MLNLKVHGNRFIILTLTFLIVSFFLFTASEVYPAPVSYIEAYDTPDDSGGSISIRINLTENEATGSFDVIRHSSDGPPVVVNSFRLNKALILNIEFTDSDVRDREPYRYELVYSSCADSDSISLGLTPETQSYPQWFASSKLPVLLGIVLYVILLFLSIYLAQRGGIDYIRKLPGLEALEDAVGRATEMGKPVLYLTGLESISNIATIASLDILSRVSKKVAEFETQLIIPCFDPIVLIISREIVRSAYETTGKPDFYREDNIYYLTDNPFGYVAAVDGIMLREKPAANFYLGAFYSDSLILAETGASTGAIQIAGTDSPIQLPFFIAACDYTLLGEELYAASAYLSKKKELLGTLKALDLMKVIILLFILIGSILLTFGIDITVFLVRF